MQIRYELSNVWQKDMSVVDYTSRIKEIYDSLASIKGEHGNRQWSH